MYDVIKFHKDVQVHGHSCCLEVIAKLEEQIGCCCVATVFDVRAKLSGHGGNVIAPKEMTILEHSVLKLFRKIHKSILRTCKERDISMLMAWDGDEGSNELNYYSLPTELAICRTRNYCLLMGWEALEQIAHLKSHTTGNRFSTYVLTIDQRGD